MLIIITPLIANITLCVNKCTTDKRQTDACMNMSAEQLLQNNETDVNMKNSTILVLSVQHCIRLDIFMQYLDLIYIVFS